jgi:hypothetical protein
VQIEREARQSVLDALLGGTPLPGGVQPLLFPDVPTIADAPTVVLVGDDEGLDLPARVRVATPEALSESVGDDTTAPVLEFLHPEPWSDRVGVRLRVSRLDAQGSVVPLGEIVVTFVVTQAGGLVVTEPTHVVAY